jgi:hypothetical protein
MQQMVACIHLLLHLLQYEQAHQRFARGKLEILTTLLYILQEGLWSFQLLILQIKRRLFVILYFFCHHHHHHQWRHLWHKLNLTMSSSTVQYVTHIFHSKISNFNANQNNNNQKQTNKLQHNQLVNNLLTKILHL